LRQLQLRSGFVALVRGQGVAAIIGAALFAVAGGLQATSAADGSHAPQRGLLQQPDDAACNGNWPNEGYPGVFLLGRGVDLTSQIDARVESVAVRMGDVVKRGDVVAQLDTSGLQSELAVMVAQHAVARAESGRMRVEVDEATRVLRSRTQLRQESLISRDELELAAHQQKQAMAGLRVALAKAAATKAQLEEVRERLRVAQVLAPFDGVVGERFVEPGATVGPSKPIVRLLSTVPPRVRFAVPEEVSERMLPGLVVQVHLIGAEGHLDGTVTRVAPELDPTSRMLFAEVELDPAAPSARLGGRRVKVCLRPERR
jgi:RND family efflux transporter MFP subunit